MLTLNNLKKENITVLYTSSYNYKKDYEYFTLNKCETITKNNKYEINNINTFLLKEFECENLINKPKLTIVDEIKLIILNSLSSPLDTFVFFNVLTYLDKKFIKKLLDYLNKENKRIINYTLDIEESLLFPYTIVIHNAEIIMEGPTKEILLAEKHLKKLGFNLPFVVDLSIGLKYYGLINEIYYTNESLVNALWN